MYFTCILLVFSTLIYKIKNMQDPLFICFADERIESDYQIYHAVESRAAQLILIEALTTGRVFAFLWYYINIIYKYFFNLINIAVIMRVYKYIVYRVI